MNTFRNREEFQEWASDQLKKYGIRQPNFFDEQGKETQ